MNRKKALVMIVLTGMLMLLLCSCGSAGSGKFTCSQCGAKVAQAYKDLAEEGAYVCEDCAEEYYGFSQETTGTSKGAETVAGNQDVTSKTEAPTEPSTEAQEEIRTEFTLEEILQGMQEGLFEGGLIAVKKGDVYYTNRLLDYYAYAPVVGGTSGYDDYIYLAEPGLWTYPELSLSAGDQIVLFSTSGSLNGTYELSKIQEKIEYCLPLFFVYDESEKGIRVYDAYSSDISYPEGYLIELNGAEMTESPLWNANLLTGELGEVITLGKFEGTTFTEYTYTCDKVGYVMEAYDKPTGIIGVPPKPAAVRYPVELANAEMTRDGYAIVFSDTVNALALEPGTYLLGGCEITITE